MYSHNTGSPFRVVIRRVTRNVCVCVWFGILASLQSTLVNLISNEEKYINSQLNKKHSLQGPLDNG